MYRLHIKFLFIFRIAERPPGGAPATVICPLCRSEHLIPDNGFFPSDRKCVNLLEWREKKKRERKEKNKRERRERKVKEKREKKEKDKRERGKKIYKVFIEFFRTMSGASHFCKQKNASFPFTYSKINCFPL